ncbi:MAG: glycosyltransferase family 2 protein [Nitrospirae bacterium]|nr:glycosyltransferase family 2 protein [Nitrospirota bacterium]MBF0535716.1 glycosyltransferase family 2 protein [Nitrospirota bacterium]MBF0617541.1 glycosyltransferase family 2 protein [Nitrospirota bacterium]
MSTMNQKTAKTLSVVIPCYNEELVIWEVYGRLTSLLDSFMQKELIKDYEIIYVDDGSSDATLRELKLISEKDRKAKVISLSGNFGHQPALTAGLTAATGEMTVSLDADLQDPPEAIEEMILKHYEGFDIVYGVRKSREEDTFFKRFTARFFYMFMRLMGVNLIYDHADYRLISRLALNEFKRYKEVNRFLRGIFPNMRFTPGIVHYKREKRFAGETKYPLRKMLSFAVEGITSFSNFPLRLAFILGFFNFVAALGLVFWTIFTKIQGNAIPGWASIVLPLYMFGGIQLMFIGILSEYVGKIYLEVKSRPVYIIKESFNFDKPL